jgi:hypothetical protein
MSDVSSPNTSYLKEWDSKELPKLLFLKVIKGFFKEQYLEEQRTPIFKQKKIGANRENSASQTLKLYFLSFSVGHRIGKKNEPLEIDFEWGHQIAIFKS